MAGWVFSDPRPIWWRGLGSNPPASMVASFEELTGDDHADAWGRSAAMVIARARRRTGEGPSFSELFQELVPHVTKQTIAWPVGTNACVRSETLRAFRLHAAIEWKRRGWISWDTNVVRSLRTGRTFSNRAKQQRKANRPAPGMESGALTGSLPARLAAIGGPGGPSVTTTPELAAMGRERDNRRAPEHADAPAQLRAGGASHDGP